MKVFFIFILGVMLAAGLGYAQEDSVTTATTSLQDVLATLKQSIQRLSVDNDQLAARDEYVKTQVQHLQMQLTHWIAQGDDLNKAAVQLQDKNPHRARQITRLEEENSALDARIQKAEGSIKSIQRSLDAGYQDEQKLLLQLKGMTNALPPHPKVQSSESQATVRRQKEKLRLLKMIYDSQQRQEALHQSILEFQKNMILPHASALARQQLLKEQIKSLENQNIAYQPESKGVSQDTPAAVDQWADTQLSQLKLELKSLEMNYLQLKDLMEKMSQKAQTVQMTVAQKTEGEKLQDSMDDLSRQNTALRADLGALRAQLVELDKRKSYLEMMTRQP